MTDIDNAISRVSGEHLLALEWFRDNRGRRVSWSELKAHVDEGARLVNQAKGIYKPHYTEYALSCRTLQEGQYPDKEVEFRSNGSWVVQYFQENADPSLRDSESTNRGLMRCIRDGVPIGFLVKRKKKPGVEYDVLGLGLVIDWEGGYFTIEGFAEDGSASRLRIRDDAARARSRVLSITTDDTEFDAASDADLRERTLSLVARRRGQAAFRTQLLEAYDGRCCMTGCDVLDVLEAAHILPYRGPQSNHAQNGLLLKADIHTLFDLGLIAVTENRSILLARSLAASAVYGPLLGQPLLEPSNVAQRPSSYALARHREWSGL